MVKILRERILFSKKLRSRQTPWEIILWGHLRAGRFGAKFKRQVVIGPFIVDFACKNKKVAVELDGSGHRNSKEQDIERTRYLNNQGYKVLRFWNSEIEKNLTKVLARIDFIIK